MKMYTQFKEESYLLGKYSRSKPLHWYAGKVLFMGLAASSIISTMYRGKGVAFDAALAIPSAGVAGRVGQLLLCQREHYNDRELLYWCTMLMLWDSSAAPISVTAAPSMVSTTKNSSDKTNSST